MTQREDQELPAEPETEPDTELLYYEDETIKGVGIPAGHHPVTNPGQLDNNPANQNHIASILNRLGAPEAALDYIYRWLGIDLDEENTLWIYYQNEMPAAGGGWA